MLRRGLEANVFHYSATTRRLLSGRSPMFPPRPDNPAFRMSGAGRCQSAKSSTNDMRPHGPSPRTRTR
jgi:hypothetical protein